MKLFLVISFSFLGLHVLSQQDTAAFAGIDQQVKNIAAGKPALLARELTLFCTTDMQKVRSIFRWITDNIDYRTRQSRPSRKNNKVSYQEPDDSGALKPLDERVAETVLENRLAVCDGYARLFKALCDHAGIESVVITGYARTEAGKRIQHFRSNHSWNAVRIDNVWQLLDVTWASGYITWQGNDFVRYYDEQYFLTSPQQFIREHYPDDLHWTLMADPPLMPEFRYSPFRQKSFSKYRITSYSPQQGLLEASLGDTIAIELQTENAAYDNQVSADPFLDTAQYNTPVSVLLTPIESRHNIIRYSFIAFSPAIQWIYILYNDDLVLRYKVIIKERPALVMNRPNQ